MTGNDLGTIGPFGTRARGQLNRVVKVAGGRPRQARADAVGAAAETGGGDSALTRADALASRQRILAAAHASWAATDA